LRQPLSALQVDLLKLVWAPIVNADMYDIEPAWPVWDFVSRELHRQHPELEDAAKVLDSLPRLARAPRYRDHPYGLVWRSSPPTIRPGPAEQIGLSIAGLEALASVQQVLADEPNGLAVLIGLLAQREARLQAKPTEVARQDLPLESFTAGFKTATAGRRYRFPDREVAKLLAHEYAPVMVFPLEVESGHQVQLGQISLRQYRHVDSAAAYLDLVQDDAAAAAPQVFYQSPLTLVQTLDYLAYVLAADPQWPKGPRLTNAPDLQSAAAVSAVVTNQHEFETALSGLCTVIDQLAVPPVPPGTLAAQANDQQRTEVQATISRLHDWLSRRLRDGDQLARVNSAISVLRAVRTVRVEAQHRTSSTQDRAVKARRRLGLPDVVSDWSDAWNAIQSQLAGALDVIRQEVQAAPPPGDQPAS